MELKNILNTIILGDSLETIKELPDECVDCVVTSPPYYALRDYGTGSWMGGGNINCNHEGARVKTRFDYALNEKQSSSKGTDVKVYKSVCPECGAVRVDKQIGQEETLDQYIGKLVELFGEIRRVLRKEGTIWLNIGDSYSDKMLMGVPWKLAFALAADGWYLRQDIIWHKPNPMPESVTDRCTKSHEYIFLLSKSERYFFDNKAIQEDAVSMNLSWKGRETRTQMQGYSKAGGHRDNSGGLAGNAMFRNKRDVWSVNVKPNKETHFATYPEELIAPCLLAGCPEGGVVLDPFMGSGTTGIVARKLNRNYIGLELNPEYKAIAERRIASEGENLFNFDTE